ncbi:MAG: VOC family protein [Planctomycetota bacterium]
MSTTWEPGTFCWNELGTRDVARAKRFYTALLGWEAEDVPMDQGGLYTLLKITGRDVGGAYEMEGPQFEGVPPHWMGYVSVADVDHGATKAKALGGTVIAEPMDIPSVGRMAVLQDPGGATFSIYKAGLHPGAARLDCAGSFCWNELATRDAGAAVEFYTQLFPWTAEVRETPHRYTTFRRGEQRAGGLLQMTEEWGDLPSHWMSYVAVDDCDACAKRVTELGGRVCVPPTDIPPAGRFAVIDDPTGATFSILQRAHP